MSEGFEVDDYLEYDEPRGPLPYTPTPLDADAFPDDAAAWAAHVSPSLVGNTLAWINQARLSAVGRIDFLTATERHRSWTTAQQHRVLAVMDTHPVVKTPLGELDRHWVQEDVSCALRLSAGTAAYRLRLATELIGRLVATVELLEAGGVTEHHARHLAEATMSLEDASATAVQAAVLGKAPDQSLASFRRAVRKAVLTIAPKNAEEAHTEGMAERRVAHTPQPDGMSGIWMLLPATGAIAFMTAVNALANRCTADDERTADQRRADAAIQLALDALTGTSSGELPREHRMRPTVNVSVALSTLLHLDEQPGDLDGYGPIPAALARRIAADQSGTWRRLVTDPTGRLVDYGRTTYRPPTDLADHVIARDRTCRFLNCNRQACRCDLDHNVPWERSGETNEANLNALCCRHHHAKHQAGWRPTRQPDGTIEWTSPTGHRYVQPPATYPIDHTTDPPRDRDSSAAAADAEQSDPDPPPF